MKPDWTPAKVNGIVGNPVYATNIAPALAKPHPLLVSEEEWIAANVKQIENLSPHEYLRNPLTILKGNYPRGRPRQGPE